MGVSLIHIAWSLVWYSKLTMVPCTGWSSPWAYAAESLVERLRYSRPLGCPHGTRSLSSSCLRLVLPKPTKQIKLTRLWPMLFHIINRIVMFLHTSFLEKTCILNIILCCILKSEAKHEYLASFKLSDYQGFTVRRIDML